MAWTIQELILEEVKKPIRRLYFKRLQRDGTYESSWTRIDTLNAINRVVDWGSVEYSIDSDEIIINAWDVQTYKAKVTNFDGKFNGNDDFRSLWFRFWGHKDTKIKVEVAMEDPDGNEVGTITAFEGVLQSAKNTGENESSLTAADYSKKLAELPFSDLGLSGSQTVQTILNTIFADATVLVYFSGTITKTPVENVTLDTDTNDVFSKKIWDVLKFIAEKSSSTITVTNDDFYFGARTTAASSADYTFTGVGNTTANRRLTIYDRIIFDQEGTDKLFTIINDTSSALTAESTDQELLASGKTKTLDLADITTAGEKQDVLDQYLVTFGVKRPTLKLPSVVFMMFL